MNSGVAAIIYTDISPATACWPGLTSRPPPPWPVPFPSVPVIASGGVTTLDDVKALLRPEYAMLEGAITGRALYDGRIDPKEALALHREQVIGAAARETARLCALTPRSASTDRCPCLLPAIAVCARLEGARRSASASKCRPAAPWSPRRCCG